MNAESVNQYFLKCSHAGHVGRRKILGIGNVWELCERLEQTGRWKSVLVCGEDYEVAYNTEIRVDAPVRFDPHLVQYGEGYYVMPITIGQVFSHFPGPYDVIAISQYRYNRDIVCHESVRVHGAGMLIVEHEDRYQEIVNQLIPHGYRDLNLDREFLTMVRE